MIGLAYIHNFLIAQDLLIKVLKVVEAFKKMKNRDCHSA